ncbi:ATP-binding protein [Chloroflexota bacterium]
MTSKLTTSTNGDTSLRNLPLTNVSEKCQGDVLPEFQLLPGQERKLIRSGKVLILEANRNHRLARTRTLSQEGYHVTSFSSVEQAAKAATRQSYELLVISGEEPELLNKLLVRFPPETSVLIVATEDTVSKVVECSGTGIHSFLVEPFSVNKFKDSVAQIIDRVRMIKEGLRSKTLIDLEQANRLLASQDGIDKFFRLVVEISAASTKADHVSLVTKDEATGKFVVKARRGDYQPTWQKICQQIIKMGKPTLLDETTQNHSRLHRLMAEAGISAVLCMPFVIKGEVTGVINHIKVTEGVGFTSSDLNFASILGWWSSIALENARLLSSLQNQQIRVEKLLREVCLAQEHERKRVSVEIHDGVAQWLVGASYDVKACSALISESRVADLEPKLAKLRMTLQRSVKELRRAIANLRPLPLEERGLVGIVKQAAEVLGEDGIRCHTEMNGRLPKLSFAQESTIYWVVQEVLTNIRNHSGATDVNFRIQFGDNTVSVEVSDNGQGFEPDHIINNAIQPVHIGLITMKERAELLGGCLSINSGPGEGTSINFSFPVSSQVNIKTRV